MYCYLFFEKKLINQYGMNTNISNNIRNGIAINIVFKRNKISYKTGFVFLKLSLYFKKLKIFIIILSISKKLIVYFNSIISNNIINFYHCIVYSFLMIIFLYTDINIFISKHYKCICIKNRCNQ